MSTIFGLNQRTILDLVRPLIVGMRLDDQPVHMVPSVPARESSFPFSEAEQMSLFARGVWSRITEPGDGLAGTLIQTLGPSTALEVLVQETPAEHVARQIAEGDAHGYLNGGLPTVRQLNESLGRWRQRLSAKASEADFQTAARANIQLVTPESAVWPVQLDDLGAHAPVALWVQGNQRLLASRSIAVVGSRAATGYGEHVTADLVTGLVRSGATIISGGAYGVDAVAHRATLAAEGSTIAVLAGGVDRLYPSAHESLFQRIRGVGLLCAELPPGSSPTKWRFLQRNRIIAALAEVTIVCEAGHRSGSLNTAGHAAELSRPIGAIPGPVTSASSAGCHRLLRDYNAVCITSPRDVIELIDAFDSREQHDQSAPSEMGESDLQRRVLDSLSKRVFRETAVIATAAGLSEHEVLLTLLELDLFGFTEQSGTGWRRGNRRNG